MIEQGQTLRPEAGGPFPFERFAADARQWGEQHDVRTVNALLDDRYGPVLLDALLQAGAGQPLRPSRDRSFTGKRDTAVRIPFNLGTHEFWGGAKLHHQEHNADGVPRGLSFTLGLPHGNGPEMARQGFQDEAAFAAYLEALFAPLPLTQPPLLESHGSLGRQTPLIPARRAEVEDKLRRYRNAWGQSRKLQVYVILTPEELESGAFLELLQAAVAWCAGLIAALQRVTAVGAANLDTAPLAQDRDTYELTFENVRALGARVGETFVVRAGSTARAQVAPSFETHHYAKLRASLIEEGRLTLQPGGEALVFQQDVPFDSASAAAAVIVGRAANGLKEWKEPGTNRTLRDSLAGVLPSEWLQAPTFEWIPFFEALAGRLLDFESAEGQVELLRVLRTAGVNINHDQGEALSVVDPFTFFSLVLKSKSDARIQGFFEVIARELNIQEAVPRTFVGVPWSDPRSA
ncbi:DUF4357 domain-containing protein [Deinococcus sp. NW-56]|uniref:DUF4357 domain-containing protein n=1 Tax=Deinococcus sp. NW-56 TaxID=2080419 RepID=UPI001F3943CA|nr:DUF4357 domain-containing protein [Deinococcus sp. NW-56]